RTRAEPFETMPDLFTGLAAGTEQLEISTIWNHADPLRRVAFLGDGLFHAGGKRHYLGRRSICQALEPIGGPALNWISEGAEGDGHVRPEVTDLEHHRDAPEPGRINGG